MPAAALFALLFCMFDFNAYSVAEPQWFDTFGHDNEDVVFGRLAASRQEGLFSHGGLLGHYSATDDKLSPQIPLQLDVYVKGNPPPHWAPYPPQIGLQGIVFGLIDRLFAPSVDTIFFYQGLTAAFTALAVTGLIVWIAEEIGVAGAAGAVIGLFMSSWLVVFGRNIYWVLGTCFLPVLVSGWGLRWLRAGGGTGMWKVMLALFAAFFVRFSVGYEYITVIGMSAWVPAVFYAYRDRWPVKRFISVSCLMAGVSIAAFLVAFAFNVAMVGAGEGGTAIDGFKTVISHAEIRLGTPLVSKDFIDPTLLESKESIQAGIPQVVDMYLRGHIYGPAIPAFNFGWPPTFADAVLAAALLSAFAGFRAWRSKGDASRIRIRLALVAAIWASFAATMSWHVVAHQHSYIHYHLNFILWYFPFMFMFFALAGDIAVHALGARLFSASHAPPADVKIKKPRTSRRNASTAPPKGKRRKAA